MPFPLIFLIGLVGVLEKTTWRKPTRGGGEYTNLANSNQELSCCANHHLFITWITEGSRDNLKKISILFLHLQFCCVMSSEAAVIKPYLIFRRGLQELPELQTINSLTSNMASSCKCGKSVSTNKNDPGFIWLSWLGVYFKSGNSGSYVAIATAEGKTKPEGIQWRKKKENG